MTAQALSLLDGFRDLRATDTMCHLGQWPYRLAAHADVDDLRRYAQRHGLRSIWVSHLAALFGFDTRTGNETTIAACGDDALFEMFAVIDPSEIGWQQEVAWAADVGFRGIRIAPGLHRYPLTEAVDVLDVCAEHEMTVQVIARMDDARVRHPLSPAVDVRPRELAEFVRANRGSALFLSGLNQADATELSRHLGDEVPDTVRMDLWHVNGPTGVADSLGASAERWVFGSGYPVQAPEPTMLQLAASRLEASQLQTITTA